MPLDRARMVLDATVLKDTMVFTYQWPADRKSVSWSLVSSTLLKALAGPFPDVVFCPTGGVTIDTAPQFLALPNVKVCGGSWLTPQDAIDNKDWARITQLAKQASALRPTQA